MKKQPKAKPYYVPSLIQKMFVVPVILLFLIQTGYLLASTILQGGDYGPQLGDLAAYNLVPILLFCLAYFINPRQLTRLSKTFEAMLIAIAAILAWSFVGALLPMLLLGRADMGSFRLYEYVSSAIFIAIYTLLLVSLRKRGVWS